MKPLKRLIGLLYIIICTVILGLPFIISYILFGEKADKIIDEIYQFGIKLLLS